MIHSYPWYIADWRNSETRLNLSMEERGLYRELLDFCYVERSLPTDERKLARIALCSDEEFKRSWPNVQHLFFEFNGRLRHKKVEEVLGKLDGYAEQRRQAGVASGERRRNARSSAVAKKGNEKLNETATRNEPTQPRPQPIPSSTQPATTTSTATASEFPETAAAVRKYFPATDDALIVIVAHASHRAYADVVNGHRAPPLTDAIIAEAVHEANFKKQESAGHFRNAVPRVIKSWAEEALRKGTIH